MLVIDYYVQPKASTFIYEETDIESELNTLTYSLGGLILIKTINSNYSKEIAMKDSQNYINELPKEYMRLEGLY